MGEDDVGLKIQFAGTQINGCGCEMKLVAPGVGFTQVQGSPALIDDDEIDVPGVSRTDALRRHAAD